MERDVNLKVEELIGYTTTVSKSKNKNNIGISGEIIDETRNTLTVETKEKERKRLIKDQNTFTIKNQEIDGSDLQGRPEERIKKWLKPKKKQRTSELK